MACVCMSYKSHIGKMRHQKIFRFLLLYNILETVYRVVHAVDGRAQAFIQMDGDLKYLIDGVSVQMQEYMKAEDASTVSFTDLDEENLNAYASPIAFDPPTLDFHVHPIGMPHMKNVVVKNLSPDTSIHMLSISGNTLHFHCSFFQEKVIPPGGNTTFDVLFLARQEGAVENILYIHTSLGSFKYQVSAIGTTNPYRLRPFVGVRMPLNSSYSPIIHMHNPHSSTLQLIEMYSSGGDLHLELPGGESEAPKQIWEIPPYETKPVVRANFIARVERNHTAFIRIRTNDSDDDYLILPVEVDVTSAPGIYSPIEALNFGVLRSQDSPKELSLSLLNSGPKHVQIVNVIVTPVNEAVDVKFTPIKVPPDTVFSTQVATITFTPSKALHSKQCVGKIVVKSKNNQFKLHIPYQVQLIKGSLDYNKSCTKFYVGQDQKNNKADYRVLNVTNNFNITIIIYNVSLPEEASSHFKVNISHPVVLLPGRSSSTAWLTFQPSDKDLQLTTYLRLHTNISHFDIPLLCFTGKLKIFLPHAINESTIDFGTLGLGDKRTMVFAVINENPVDVNLKLWGSNSTKTYVELVGVDKGNASTLAWRHNFSAMARSLVLQPQHYAIFRIGITAPAHEGLFSGQAFVETQYEKINVTFTLRTAKGSLKADDLLFENAFPGKISSQNLYVHSTFSHSMTVTAIIPEPEDSRFIFDTLRNEPSVLHPNSRNLVGKVLFDPRKYCKQKCYSGLPTTTSMGHQWLLGMALSPDVGDMDKELYRTLSDRWQSLLDLEGKSLNVTLRLDTTEVRGFYLKARASLHWPRLFSRNHLKFPITQIGNRTVKDFTLENPSNLPLLVQMVPLQTYPNPQDILSRLTHKLSSEFQNYSRLIGDSEVFTLEDLEEHNPNPENHIPAYRKSLEEYFGVQSHKQSIAMLLTPGMRVRIQVGFSPKDNGLKSSMILIRNNLTVMDAFMVQGQGGHGQIKFGNLSPGSEAFLMFELTDKHLTSCDGSQSAKFVQPNFTVRRTFTARNTGALPVYIQRFDINGIPCEAYGFRILTCDGFELKPNASQKVDIAFTPDFTLSRVDRILNIHTSQGPGGHSLHFNLVATVPRHMLPLCSQALPRPHWENILYYTCIAMACVAGLCELVIAYLESKRIIQSCFLSFATVGVHQDKIEKGPVFDLKSISSCSNMYPQNTVKNNTCLHADVRRKKDSFDQTNLSDSFAMCNQKHTVYTKHKETSTAKYYDDNTNDHNIRHIKKRIPKTKQIQDSPALEPDLCEIKKPQVRNSWTRFLKPPFSFRAYSDAKIKPSVSTQTSQDTNEGNDLKSLEDLNVENGQDMSSVVVCENNLKEKSKFKKDCKYIDLKNRPKKQIENLPEEETSSTTTETSTTESDISEKDHRLPDVCVTTKPVKSRHIKSKSRDNNVECDSRCSLKTEEFADGDGFELSTKSRGHKKIKVDPNKVFGGDILRPNTLELPYKPKPVILDPEKEILMPEESQSSVKDIHSVNKLKANCYFRRNSEGPCRMPRKFSIDKSVKNALMLASKECDGRNCAQEPSSFWDFPLGVNHDDSLAEIVQQTESFRRCLWPSNESSDDVQVSTPKLSDSTNHPPTYSAAVSRDITSRKKSKSCIPCGNRKTFHENITIPIPIRSQRPAALYLPSNNITSSPVTASSNIWGTTALASANSPHTPEDSSSSNTKRWSVQSKPDYCSQGINISVKGEEIFNPDIGSSDLSRGSFGYTATNIWNNSNTNQPLTMMQALQAERRHRLEEYRKKMAIYNDWPGFDMPPIGESLWDHNYMPPVDSWANESVSRSDGSSNPALAGAVVGEIGECSKNWRAKVKSDWEVSSTLWSTPCDKYMSSIGESVVSTSVEDSSIITEKDSKPKDVPTDREYDPFHSLSTLWIPQLSNCDDEFVAPPGSETWSFSLFSDPSPPVFGENCPDEKKNVKQDKQESSK